MPPSTTDSTFRPVVWLMTGRALGQAAAFLIPVLLVRAFDADTFGSYRRLFLLYGTLYGIAQLGLAESLYYFLPRSPASGGKLAANAMLGLGAIGVACLALLSAARTPVAQLLGDAGLAGLVPWLALFLAPMLVSSVLEIAMVSRREHGAATLAYFATDLSRAALLILPALLVGSLRALLIGAVAFAFARMLATLVWLGRRMGELRFDRALLAQQLGYAVPFALAVTVETVQANLHQYVVSASCDAAAFAVYSVALLQVPLVDQAATTTGSVLMVQMGEALQQRQPEQVRALWHDTVARLALLFFPLVTLLLVAGREVIVTLFTARYADSVPLFRLAALGILLLALQSDAVLRVLAETRFLLGLNVLRLALVAVLIGPFLARFQLAGAVLVVLVAGLVGKAVGLARIAHLLGLGLVGLLPWRRLAVAMALSAGAGLLAFSLRAVIGWPPLPRLLAVGAAFVLGYALLGRMLGVLPRLAPSGWIAWLRGTAIPADGRP